MSRGSEGERGGLMQRAKTHFRVPVATYRLQFNRQFTFQHAAETVDYLHELGISDYYASPLFRARRQSTHGYDICGFDEFNPNLGGIDGFERLVARLKQFGLGLLLDMVPNHMGAGLSNVWWSDVLEKGRDSTYADWFDIDWQSPNPALRGKILLPVLEAPYAKVLESGKLKLVLEKEHFTLAYHDRQFPVAMPRPFARSAKSVLAINGIPGVPESFDELDSLLRKQHYRLAFWRVGPELVNYRRFFDIPDLVSLRMELAEVFEATHELVFQLIHEGKITGLRIDHPDGLWDPKEYFERLQLACGWRQASRSRSLYVVAEKILIGDETLPTDWPVSGSTGYDFLNQVNGLFVDGSNRSAMDRIYAEFTGESCDYPSLLRSSKRRVLLASFRSELNTLLGLLRTIAASTRYGLDLTATMLRGALVEILACFPVYRCYVNERTVVISGADKKFIDKAITRAQKQVDGADKVALQFIAGLLRLEFPRDLPQGARKLARRFSMKFQQLTAPLMAKGLEDTTFYNYNRLISLNEVGGDPERFGTDPAAFHAYNLANAQRWPHTLLATGTHDTKRGEDARARINVLAEIPEAWQEAVLRWKRQNTAKKTTLGRRRAPCANDEYLLYQTLIGAWAPEIQAPERLQRFTERIAAYLLKATREAKTHTSWMDPDAAYEQATRKFVEQLLSKSESNSFLSDFQSFHKRIAFFGCLNSLAQTLIKMTAPGVPDFYQGTELWDFSLVDPDNRRPVDFELRREMLADIKSSLSCRPSNMPGILNQLLQDFHTGKIKLYLIWRTLKFRREHRRLFDQGHYVPLPVSGPKSNHVFAFARVRGPAVSVTIVPRLITGLCERVERRPLGHEVWQDTYIAGAKLPDAAQGSSRKIPPQFKPGELYHNVLTGEIFEIDHRQPGLPVAVALASFPVALLEPVR